MFDGSFLDAPGVHFKTTGRTEMDGKRGPKTRP